MAKDDMSQVLMRPDDDRADSNLDLLVEMTRDFAASLDIEGTLTKALHRVIEYLDAAGGALFLLENEGKSLRCCASVGVTDIAGIVMNADEGIVGRCVRKNAGEIVRDVADDPDFYSGVDAETGFITRSILCAPMRVQDQRIGAIELVNKRVGDGLFADADLQFLQALSSAAALAILNARMAEALVEQERVRRELELASEIQRSLLPPPGPDAFPVHGVNVPAREMSGDFYDFFSLADGRICFTLGDVSGKGMNAALLMAKTASLFRCLGKERPEPGRLLARVNAEICETATRGMFVTMVGGVLDPATGVARIANAGHEPPLYHAADGTFTAIPAEAPPIGIVPPLSPDESYPETEIDLAGGNLYIFSDGVTEGHLHDGTELLVEGLQDLLTRGAEQPAPARLAVVVKRLVRDGGDALRDDITLLSISGGPARPVAMPAAVDEPIQTITESEHFELRFPSRPDRLKHVRKAVHDAAIRLGCGERIIHDIVLAVDEACQNVIRHAYANSPDGEIVLEILGEEDSIVVLIRDFAPPVDPTRIGPRDLADIRPGGLGTHFMRMVMDTVEFLPPPGGRGNLLRMAKRIA
jgi:sigma-B regulation protein RsbU (phosphoserine phosphatase)